MKARRWAVAQDLRPFGFRIESTHRSRWRALRKARTSRYLAVYTVDDVLSENHRLWSGEAIMAEIDHHKATGLWTWQQPPTWGRGLR